MGKQQPIIPFYRPRAIDTESFFRKVTEIIDTRQFTNAGEKVLELEKKIAELHNVQHCIAVCNGTMGLQLVLKGLDLTGEVITTPFTFVATAHAIMWQGLTPVFADIDLQTLTISPERIAELITPKTSAILGVHVFGQPCDVEAIAGVAEKHKLKVIYDAAHSFMTSCKGVSIGNFGDAEVLSFHATKLFHTLEGGAILTNNSELAARLRLLKNFGFKGIDIVDYLGVNAKMNEMSAAYGLSLLPYLPETISRLKEIHAEYRSLLRGVKGIHVYETGDNVTKNWQYLPLFVDEALFGISRSQLWAYLWDNGIQSRRYFYPGIHLCKPYRSFFKGSLPVTEKVSGGILCLPCYYDLDDEDIQRVSKLIGEASHKSGEIKQWYDDLLKSPEVDANLQQIINSLKRSCL